MEGDIMFAWATASAPELKALSDPIGNGVMVLEVCGHRQFRILSVNLAIETITGLRHAALSGLSLTEVLPEREAYVASERYQKCVDQKQRASFVDELELPERKFWWQTSVTPIFDLDGIVVRLLASTVDFTDRHNLERELRTAAMRLQQSQSRLQWAVVGGEIGIWEWDVTKRLIWMADPWPADMKSAVSSEAIPIDRWVELIHPAHRAMAVAMGERAVLEDIPAYSMDYQVKLLSGEWQWRHVYGTITERDDAGRAVRICGTYQDITQRKRDQEALRALTAELEHRATHDSLTGVMNRGAIIETLEKELVRADRGFTGLTVALLDVDHFKSINDRYGHPVGDHVLIAMVERIRAVLRPYDHIGRYGGEEFLIIAPAKNDIDGLHERIREAVAQASLSARGRSIEVTVSIGLAHYSTNFSDSERLLTAADEALYCAKKRGRNRVAQAERT